MRKTFRERKSRNKKNGVRRKRERKIEREREREREREDKCKRGEKEIHVKRSDIQGLSIQVRMIHRQKGVKCEVRKKSVSAKERICVKRRGKNERTVVGRKRLGRDERGCVRRRERGLQQKLSRGS